MDKFDKIKMRAIKSTVRGFLPKIQDFLKNIISQKSEIELRDEEVDIICFAFSKNEKVYVSLATVSNNREIKRTLYVAEVNEENILKLLEKM